MSIQTQTQFPKWRQLLCTVLDYLIVIFTVLGAQSVFNNATEREYHILPICAGLLALHLLLFPDVLKWQNFKKFLYIALPWTAWILVYAVVAGGDRVKLIEKFIVVLLLYCAYFWGHRLRGTHKNIFRYYVYVIFLIALVSLFMWLTCSVLKWFLPSGPFYMYWGKERKIWTFYYLYFHWQNDFFIHGFRFYRNIGIFAEAPMFSLHLTTALMLDVLINDKRTKFSYFRFFILAATVGTTFSITGYLFVMVLFVVDIYAELIVRARSKDPVIATRAHRQLAVVTIFGMVLGVIGYSLVADKLASRSGGSRTEDYSNGYKGWRDNVWFGAGFGDIEARQRYASWRRLHRSESGFTNSPMAILCEGGLWFFLCYYIPFMYDIIVVIMKRDWRAMFCMGLLVLLFVTTTMEHTCLILAFLGFSLSSILAEGYKKESGLLGRPLIVPVAE